MKIQDFDTVIGQLLQSASTINLLVELRERKMNSEEKQLLNEIVLENPVQSSNIEEVMLHNFVEQNKDQINLEELRILINNQ